MKCNYGGLGQQIISFIDALRKSPTILFKEETRHQLIYNIQLLRS